MAHCRITIIGTEEQYDKVYDYLMEKENPGYFEDVRNGMDEMYAFYKWGSFNSIGGSDWVKVERTNITKQEYVDNDLTKYIEWYNNYGDDERGYRGHYILDVREADTNLENIDLDCYLLSEYIEKIKSLPEDVNIMVADSHW